MWVNFTHGNTAANPTLNVNSTGTATIQINGSAFVEGSIAANTCHLFVFDGTNWQLINPHVEAGGEQATPAGLGIGFGTNTQTAATAARTVALEGFVRNVGSRIVVHFSNAITAANPTLNVNGTGAAAIQINGAALQTASITAASAAIPAGHRALFVFDGTAWQLLNPSLSGGAIGTLPITSGGTGQTSVANATAAFGIGSVINSETPAGTAAKAAPLANFVRRAGAFVWVNFTNGNTHSNPTLNVNSTGANAIQVHGGAFVAGSIVANTRHLFVFDGTNWQLINPHVAGGGSASVDLANSTGILPITNGGTGAVTAAAARIALGAAPLDSPAFIGVPTAPTPPQGTADETIATTQFVQEAIHAETEVGGFYLDAWMSHSASNLGNNYGTFSRVGRIVTVEVHTEFMIQGWTHWWNGLPFEISIHGLPFVPAAGALVQLIVEVDEIIPPTPMTFHIVPDCTVARMVNHEIEVTSDWDWHQITVSGMFSYVTHPISSLTALTKHSVTVITEGGPGSEQAPGSRIVTAYVNSAEGREMLERDLQDPLLLAEVLQAWGDTPIIEVQPETSMARLRQLSSDAAAAMESKVDTHIQRETEEQTDA